MIPPDGVGLQPRFRGRRIDVAEIVLKRRGSSFYFSKDTFNRISETVLFDAVAVVFAAETTDQIVCVIDEKQSIFDVVFLS
jgi:uncharacterized protein (DUF433 family)